MAMGDGAKIRASNRRSARMVAFSGVVDQAAATVLRPATNHDMYCGVFVLHSLAVDDAGSRVAILHAGKWINTRYSYLAVRRYGGSLREYLETHSFTHDFASAGQRAKS